MRKYCFTAAQAICPGRPAVEFPHCSRSYIFWPHRNHHLLRTQATDPWNSFSGPLLGLKIYFPAFLNVLPSLLGARLEGWPLLLPSGSAVLPSGTDCFEHASQEYFQLMLSGDTLDLPHPLLLTSSTAPLGYVQSFRGDAGSGSLSLCNVPPAITLGTSVSTEMLLPTSWPDVHPPMISPSTRP